MNVDVTVAVGKCFFGGVDAKGWRGDGASEKQLSVLIICRGWLIYLNLNNNLTVTHCCTQSNQLFGQQLRKGQPA
jgi:hypothetical protein